MKRATENRGNIRTLSEYFSPKSKVKDLALQEHSLPHFTSSLQETPMKPSQVPNQLPHPVQRKMFPLQRPELCNRDRPGPPRHPSHHTGPIYSSGHVPSSPTNTGSSANRPHLTARDRLGPFHHSAQPPGTYCSRLTPVSQTNSGTTANGPQPSPWGVSHPPSPQFVKDSSKDSLSKITLSYSGSKNITGQRQDSNKAQSSNVRSSIQTVQLHRPPVTPSLDTQAAQEDCRLPHSENWSPRNSHWPPRGYQPSPSTQSSDRSSSSAPVTPCQDHQLKRTPSTEKVISAVDLDHSSQKRSRQFEDCGDSVKKVCLRGVNSGNAQTPKPTVGNSLSPSLVSQPSLGDSSVLELSSKTTDSHLCTEPAWDQSASLEITTQSSCTSMGAKQAYISSSHNQTLRLKEFRSSSKPGENDKRSSLLSSDTPQKDTSSSPCFQLGSHNSVYSHRSTSVLPAKTPSRGDQVEESRRLDSKTISASKPISGSLSCRKVERNKTARQKRPAIIPDDINDLFTPDPMTYVVSHKTAKPKIDGGTIKSSSTFPSKSPFEKSCSSSFVSSSSTTVTASSCLKKQNFTETGSPHAVDTKIQSFSSASQPQVSFPTVALKRINLENLKSSSEDDKLRNSPVTSSGKLLKNESAKLNEKHASLLSNNVRHRTLETDTAVCKQTSTPHSSQSPLLERQASEGSRKKVNEEDPIDVELDLVQSYMLDLDESQSSHSSESSEEDQLISLKEMMEHVNKPPDTPEKGTFSEPSTPGHPSCQSKTLLPSTTKSYIYKNNLDQMLKEINDNKKTKEIERQLLNACKEDLLRIAEYEEAEENRDGGISTEHQEFLQRYSLMSSAIREVPPGEVVFNLEKFGRIFNQDTLQLRQCMVNPQGTAQKTLLWSSPAQLRLNLNIGLFQEAYDCRSPCPTQVTRFLFKMMSVHNERMVSEKILQALCDIACTAACQIVKNGSQQFNVWVPSLADVALVLMNMGIAFVTLFPFENLQPPFTEGDLLEDINISKTPSSNEEKSTFPEHNCNNILKYLSYCMDLCPRAYSDNELLLLLTVLGRVGLDTQLILQSTVELYPLQYKIVNNIRDWDNMLPRICVALTDLTDDHHNMCLLVQTLPDNTRGKQLRRHLSLSMISKLLDGKCTYKPTEKEIQLSELRLYLPRMQPSTLLRGMLNSSRGTQKAKEDMATLDQQAYYLCYSLLTLANEASKFQFFPAHQKEQLLVLSSELETHVKCDIRESEKCLYRSKVKDLVARIYTKWQMLLQRTRPLNGKLYDYWQPLSVDTSTSSQEEQEIDTSDDGERLVIDESDEEEEENSTTEENDDALITKEKEEGDDTMNERIKIGNDTKPEVTEGDGTMADSTETGDNTKPEDVEGDNTMADSTETGDNTKPEDVEGDNTMDDSTETGDNTKPEDVEGDNTMADSTETGDNTKPEDVEGDNTMDDSTETGDNTKPEDVEEDNMMAETNDMEETTELVPEEINSVLPEMEPQVHKESKVINVQAEARNVDCTQVETENFVEAKETSEDEQAALCNIVS